MFYWVLIWTLSNETATFESWGIQFLLCVIQDVFINQPLQLIVVHLLVINSVRPQLRQIFNVLKNLVAYEGESSSHVHGDRKKHDHVYKDVRVVQYLSSACRAARMNRASHLPASQILMQLGDYELALCREMRYSALSIIVIALISIPAILAFASPQVQDVFLDIVIPAMWNTFLLVNALMLAVSPGLLVTPYIIVFLYLSYRLYLLRRVRRKYLRSSSQAHSSTKGWRGRGKKSLESNKKNVLTYIDRIVLKIHKTFSRQKKSASSISSTELLWRNMNMSLLLQGKVGVIVPHKKSMESDAVSDSGQSSSVSVYSTSTIPEELLRSQSFQLSVDKQGGSTSYLNRKLWRAETVDSQTIARNNESSRSAHSSNANENKEASTWNKKKELLYNVSDSTDVMLSNSKAVSRWKEKRMEEQENFPLEFARELFMGLDADKSGFLEGSELHDLSLWVWDNFYFGKPNPSGDELDEVLDKLLYVMDKDKEGRISLMNFTKWFSDACDDVIKYQQSFTDLAPFFYRS